MVLLPFLLALCSSEITFLIKISRTLFVDYANFRVLSSRKKGLTSLSIRDSDPKRTFSRPSKLEIELHFLLGISESQIELHFLLGIFELFERYYVTPNRKSDKITTTSTSLSISTSFDLFRPFFHNLISNFAWSKLICL